MPDQQLEVSVVIPCLNEAETLETVIRKAQSCIRENNLTAEVIVADNGSTDGSQAIAERLGARVVTVKDKGYGNALRGGIEAAHGKYIIMGDADDSYDFSAFFPFVEKMRNGAELVMGTRLKGKIMPGAMPWKNHYIGNPIQTKIGQIIFRCPITDFNCGLRGFTKDAFHKMGLVTTTWEFASEMVIKAVLQKLRIEEVPITLHKDGRSHPPHLQPWRAGWRNIRFMLLHSPKWLFMLPGWFLLALGLIGFGLLLPGPLKTSGMMLDISSLLFAMTACLVGLQVLSMGLLARAFAVAEGLLPKPKARSTDKLIGLEYGLVFGIILAMCGIGLLVLSVVLWSEHHFGLMRYQSLLRLVIPACTLVATGTQLAFTGWLLGVLQLKRAPRVPQVDPE
jgi:glycosyltransferase involved in cell wall biosynthesis